MTVNFHPIQAVKTNWSEGSKAKKAAMVAGTVVGAAAVGSAIYAGVKGKSTADAKGIKKFTSRMADGYKQLGSKIKNGWNKIFKKTEKVDAQETGKTTPVVEDKGASNPANPANEPAPAPAVTEFEYADVL